ncbi:MAG: DUF3320 domain-containing protein, partial [Methanobrevibacter sp.]|nr:DUF3320 domain-containing protein [Methanobrevibacter sp.]
PLRKNTVAYSKHKTKDSDSFSNKLKSVGESISDFKNEVKYISNSLKEIEDPSAPEEYTVIDRTKINNNDTKENINNTDNNINNNTDIDTNNTNNINISNKTNQIHNNSNIVENSNKTNNSFNKNSEEFLESVIKDINNEYIEDEKERYKESNQFKNKDDRILPKNDDLESFIMPYEITDNITINSSDELHNTPVEKLSEDVNKVVAIEGPIHINELITRIKEKANIKRLGPKIKNRITKAIYNSENSGTVILIDDFLFPINKSKIQVRKRDKPNIDLISNEEIEENLKLILKHNSSLKLKELVKQAANNFGFKATSKKTSQKISNVIDYLIVQKVLIIDNDQIELFNDKTRERME